LIERIGFLFCLMIALVGVDAQAPNWTVDYSQFPFRMTVSAVLEHDGTVLEQGENKVAVFVGDEIRGIGYADSYHEPTDRYLAIFQIGSDVAEGETLDFVLYDEDADEIVDVRFSATFSVDGLLGSVNDPVILSENQFPQEIQLPVEAFLENLEVGGVITNLTTVDGDDLSHTYFLSNFDPPEASELIGVDGEKLIATAENDFETLNSFTFSIRAEDPLGASVSNDFRLNLIDEPEAPTNLILSRQRFSENNNSDFELALISADDEDLNESLTYSFARSEENLDSVYFNISNNRLIVRSSVDYELTPSFQLLITVSDKDGLSLTDTFEIKVEDEDEPEPLSNYLSPNGDGFNDFLIIENPELYIGFTLKVYTPQGREVFNMTNYDNSWDGYFQGKPLPSGVYQYVFQNKMTGVKYDGFIYIKER